MQLLPFGLAHAFLQAPVEDTQGSSSTGDGIDDAADDALVAAGELEMDASEDGDPEAIDDPDAQPDEDEEDLDDEEGQDDEDEEAEEEVDEEEEEVAAAATGFKFKGKDGNFDWQRINKVLGDDTLEKAIRTQNSTITKYSQEIKSLKENGVNTPEVAEVRKRAGFFDHLMAHDPGVRKEVLRALGEPPQRGQQGAGGVQLPEGVDPNDPLAPVVMQLAQTLQTIQHRTQESDRQAQQIDLENRFVSGLREARAEFQELLGAAPTDEQLKLIAEEMKQSGDLRGSRFVTSLFKKEILAKTKEQARAEFLKNNADKRKKLTKTGLGRRSGGSKGAKKSAEQDFDELWDEHRPNG